MRYISLFCLVIYVQILHAACIAPLKTFIIQKIKKFCNAKNIFTEEYDIFAFSKKMALQNFLYFANC
jgi:hypothetical protein